jgi:hypothetical protein
MRVFTVYRGGGDFLPKHVQALQRQVLQWSPVGTTFLCLSSVPIDGVLTYPLQTEWPGFWAKMELLDPAIAGDFLFMDLDTAIIGPIDDFLKPRPLTTFGGALMWLPEADRVEAGEIFRANPEGIMREYGGEDVFLRAVWAGQHTVPRTFIDQVIRERKMTRQWTEDLPEQICFRKYRGLVQPGRITTRSKDARIVIFSGLPRPWHTAEFSRLYR